MLSNEKNNKYIIVLTDGIPNLSLFESTATTENKQLYSDYSINRTKNKLKEITKNDVTLITMLTGIDTPDTIVSGTTKTYSDIIKEVFGTAQTPTSGMFYYISDEDIEKTYVLQDSTNKNGYLQVLENAPDIYLEIVHHIIEMAQLKISSPFNKQIFVTLLDHLLYAVERYEKGIVLQNRMLWEIQKFYPNEFMLGLQAVDYINETLNVKLPEAEAGNIAFHFVNAQIKSNDLSTENGMLMVKMLKDIFQIIQLHYGYTIDENSLNYSRFVVHMQFFLQRLLEDKMLENENDDIYYTYIIKNSSALDCVEQIEKYIDRLLHKQITRDEKIYLIVHITRITTH